MLTMAKEMRLEMCIDNHKNFQMPVPNKVTSGNNVEGKHPCPQGQWGLY